MILAIDCGNTRAKWGLTDRGTAGEVRFSVVDAVTIDRLERFEHSVGALPPVERIVISNVANAQIRGRIEHAVARFGVSPIWVKAQASACGVTNRYDVDALGTDRWIALIGAWHRHRGASVVVNCGTATTVDRLTATGEFVGGMILPSVALMKKALAENTARLPLADGRYSAEPRVTVDAIESGCIEATVGAVERARSRAGTGARLFLTGGASALVAALLAPPIERVEHLTLEGLVRLAQ
jgi:type III pantothenate kinase